MPLLELARSVVAPPFCWSCGEQSRPRDPLCLACRSRLRWLDRRPVELEGGLEAWAPVAYDGPARALVRGLKYRGAAGLAATMAAQIAAVAPDDLLTPPAVLVPVPLHPRRARARGYNQAGRLALELSRRTGLRVDDCLRRSGMAGGRQVGRGRAERLSGIAGTVELRRGARPPWRTLLVDDVITTGATLTACAGALAVAGTDSIAAVAYALTPSR
jgi:ComF family protein